MNTERDIGAGWQAEVLGRQSLIVESVACLVENPEERTGKVPLVIPGGDTAIARPRINMSRPALPRRRLQARLFTPSITKSCF